MAPEGLGYVSRRVDTKLERCHQWMEVADPALLGEWMANWQNLVEFEVNPVMASQEAVAKIAPLL
jgi:hypothetical protein